MKAVNDLKKFLASFDDVPSTPREGDKTEADLEVPVPNPFDSIRQSLPPKKPLATDLSVNDSGFNQDSIPATD